MFLEVSEDLPDHPKALRLCRLLMNPLGWAYLILLWRWCSKYAKDGDLTKFTAEEIELACKWTLDPGKLYAALKQSGWVDDLPDGRCVCHDWMDHQGKWIAKMEADRKRKEEERKKGRRSDDRHPDLSPTPGDMHAAGLQTELPALVSSPSVQRTSNGHPKDVHRMSEVPNLTKPNPTRPNQTKPRVSTPGKPAGGDVHTQVLGWFCGAWKDAYGSEYKPTPADKSQCGRMIRDMPPTEIATLPGLFAAYMRSTGKLETERRHDLAWFCTQGGLNRYRVGEKTATDVRLGHGRAETVVHTKFGEQDL